MSTRFNVLLDGWMTGLQTIDLMKVIRTHADLQLGDAMRLVNGLLDGEAISLDFASADEAQAFLAAARSAGAEGTLSEMVD